MVLRKAWAACLGALATTATLLASGSAQAVTVATFDADQFNTNGFAFADFADTFFGTLDTSNGLIELDVNNDIDGMNGLFGGLGSDLLADFDTNTTTLEVVYRIGAENVAETFRVMLIDDDGANTGTEYAYDIPLLGDVFDPLPTGEFLTFTTDIPSFLFSQDAFGGGPGDGIQNFGLRQVQVQSVFDSPDRLTVDIQSIKLIDSEQPIIVELTTDSFARAGQSFDFGTFSEAGVVDQSGGTFVVDTSQSEMPQEAGGLGFNGLNIDFEATEFAIEVEAKLLPGNDATSFVALLGDNDGDDSAPMLGSDDYVFAVPTSAFNESEFSTFTIPLGTGSETAIETTFGFTNGGDGLQNFDLSQLQLQVDADNTGVGGLRVEVARISIIEFDGPVLMADFNGDGSVDLLDLDILGANFGGPGDAASGDANGDGVVDLLDLDILGGEFGSGGPSSVPEPSGLVLVLGAAAIAGVSRRR